MEDRLIFVIAAPRSGSTLLARMLGAHPRVSAPAELHLLTPLAHLGFHERVDAAPYDPVITQRGLREMVSALPEGEADYLAALRASTDAIYAKLLEPTGRDVLLEKTPAYALVLDFIAKLYPGARYVVLTRNPLAIWSSVVQSFFDGDEAEAERISPGLGRFVPAIARFLRERPVAIHHLRYEELVRAPEAAARSLCDFANLSFEPGMIDYGSAATGSGAVAKGLGDPITVGKETRPTTQSIARWAEDMSGDAAKVAQAQRILGRLTDEDLETWGYDRGNLEAELAAIPTSGPRRGGRAASTYTLERKLLAAVRRQVHRRQRLAALVRKCREACDVLLR
ncbi:MAG: sulfotransferase [Myxococcota bacterium]|nr:sulfotransferase [Myxococcota bacterium]